MIWLASAIHLVDRMLVCNSSIPIYSCFSSSKKKNKFTIIALAVIPRAPTFVVSAKCLRNEVLRNIFYKNIFHLESIDLLFFNSVRTVRAEILDGSLFLLWPGFVMPPHLSEILQTILSLWITYVGKFTSELTDVINFSWLSRLYSVRTTRDWQNWTACLSCVLTTTPD